MVKGIDLASMVWTDGDLMLPVDNWVYDKAGEGKTKNGHFQVMLVIANQQGFRHEAILFDSWYSGLAGLKRVRDYRSRPSFHIDGFALVLS